MTNKRPISFLQIDKRWKDIPYSVPGEQTTIGESGCGPTSAAMLISTLTGKTITPIDTCKWAVDHGYKALRQGTYYSYFEPQFKQYGITCKQLNVSRILNDPEHRIHDLALEMLKDGFYLIALMGPGLWTPSGHYVVVWWLDNVYHILDPYSTKTIKMEGDINRFRNECRMYWAIDARNFNKEDDEMTQEEFNQKLNNYLDSLKKQDPSDWSSEAREWAEEEGLIVGDQDGNKQYKSFMTREQAIIFMHRLSKMK